MDTLSWILIPLYSILFGGIGIYLYKRRYIIQYNSLGHKKHKSRWPIYCQIHNSISSQSSSHSVDAIFIANKHLHEYIFEKDIEDETRQSIQKGLDFWIKFIRIYPNEFLTIIHKDKRHENVLAAELLMWGIKDHKSQLINKAKEYLKAENIKQAVRLGFFYFEYCDKRNITKQNKRHISWDHLIGAQTNYPTFLTKPFEVQHGFNLEQIIEDAVELENFMHEINLPEGEKDISSFLRKNKT